MEKELHDREIEPALDWVVKTAQRLLKVRKTYLFGAHANNEAQKDDPIDLAFEIPIGRRVNWDEFVAECEEDAPTLLTINFVNLETLSDARKAEIVAGGRVIFESSALML